MIIKNSLTSLKPLLFKIAIFLAIFIILVIFSVIIFRKPAPPSKESTSQPSSISSLKQAEGFKDELSKIKKHLSYTGPNYSVEYVNATNLINAKIKAPTAEEYLTIKKNVEEFIKSSGVKDICVLNIFWIPQTTQQVRKSIKGTDLFTTGCKP